MFNTFLLERDVGHIGVIRSVLLCVCVSAWQEDYIPLQEMWKQVWAFLLSVKTISWPACSSQLVSHGSSCSVSLRALEGAGVAGALSSCSRILTWPPWTSDLNISELERTSGHLVQTFFLQRKGQRPTEGKSPAFEALGRLQCHIWNQDFTAVTLLPLFSGLWVQPVQQITWVTFKNAGAWDVAQKCKSLKSRSGDPDG